MDGRLRVRSTTMWLVAFTLLMAVVPTSAASAATPIFVVVEGTATLSGGIGTCGTGTFAGTATGLHGEVLIVGATTTASFTYCNPDVVTGTASGTVTIDGHSCGFNWSRVLNRATITFHSGCSGYGTAEFTPTGFNTAHILAKVGIV